MELIKKIKQAEAQAQEIIKQAKAEAAALAEKGQKHRQQLLEESTTAKKKNNRSCCCHSTVTRPCRNRETQNASREKTAATAG